MHGLHATESPSSNRQQTSSDLSGPFNTARAVTVGAIRIAMQLHTSAWQALVWSWVADVRMQSNPPLCAFVCIWAYPPSSLTADVLYGNLFVEFVINWNNIPVQLQLLSVKGNGMGPYIHRWSSAGLLWRKAGMIICIRQITSWHS